MSIEDIVDLTTIRTALFLGGFIQVWIWLRRSLHFLAIERLNKKIHDDIKTKDLKYVPLEELSGEGHKKALKRINLKRFLDFVFEDYWTGKIKKTSLKDIEKSVLLIELISKEADYKINKIINRLEAILFENTNKLPE